MDTLKEGVFSAKTVEEAIEKGLTSLNLTREQAEITVLEEGKKKLFGSIPASVKVCAKKSDGARAAEFIDGLLEALKINGVSEVKKDDEKIEIEIQTVNSHAVIGRRGEVLDAIQCIAGAVANIGNEEYKKVVVDCESYRAQREQTLINLANKLAKKAVEKGRKVTLEPMNPYERRIIHSALANSTEVKTESEGKEPRRYVVIVPNNLKPYERRERSYGDRRYNDRKPYGDRERRDGDKKPYGDRKGGYRDRKPYGEKRDGDNYRRDSRPARGKKEIHFGTYLGNSKTTETTPAETPEEENKD